MYISRARQQAAAPQGASKLTSGLIVDLRGKRGGSFMTADYFLKPGTFTGSTVWRSGKEEIIAAEAI
jgi:C-terminal processing protease CtpA/Prc